MNAVTMEPSMRRTPVCPLPNLPPQTGEGIGATPIEECCRARVRDLEKRTLAKLAKLAKQEGENAER